MSQDTTVKILDIQVKYQKALEDIAKYRVAIEEAKKQQKELKKEYDSGAISIESYSKQMEASKVFITQQNTAINTLSRQMNNQIKSSEEMSGSLTQLRAKLSILTQEYDKLSAAERNGAKGEELKNHINEITNQLKGAEEGTQRFYRNVGNYSSAIEPFIESLNNKLDEQKKVYEKLIKTQGEHSTSAKEQKKAIEDTQLELEFFSSTAGNANNSILGLISSGTGLNGSLLSTITQMRSLSQGVTLAGTAVKALGKQFRALMANPIVALLGIIAAALMAISKGISTSENNTNRWRTALAPFNRIIQDCIAVIQFFAGYILNIVEAGGQFLGWINKMCENIPVLGKHFKEQNNKIKEGIDIEKERQAIEKQGRVDAVRNAKEALTVAELRVKAKDKEKFTAKERLEFIKEANKLEEQQSKRNVELEQRKLKALQIESSWADNDAETNQKLADQEVAVYNARKAYFEKARMLQREEVALQSEIQSEEKEILLKKKEAAEKAIEIAKERADKEREAIRVAEDAMLSIIKDNNEKARKTISLNYDRQIEDLRIKLNTEKNLTEKAKDAILKTIVAKEKEKQKELNRLSDEALKKEIEDRKKLIDLRLEGIKAGTEQEYQLKIQSLQAQQEAELRNTEITEEEKLLIKQKYNKKFDSLTDEYNKALYEKQRKEIETRFNLLIAENELEKEENSKKAAETEEEALKDIEIEHNKSLELLSLKTQRAEDEYNLLLEEGQRNDETEDEFNLRKIEKQIELQNANKAISDEDIKYKEQIKEKEISIENAKLDASLKVMGGISALTKQLGEDNKGFAQLSKILALAEITINTGKAIAAGVAQAQSVPFPGNIAAIATTVATILANITTAISTVKSAKFAKGGKVNGPGTATSDSIPAMLSNGEYVVTAKATSLFEPLLAAMNSIGSGVPVQTFSSNRQAENNADMSDLFKDAVKEIQPVVSVVEITEKQNRVSQIENLDNY